MPLKYTEVKVLKITETHKTMTKNEIIKTLLDGFIKQRADLNYELANLNHNEPSFNDRKITLEFAISNIDIQISNRVMDLELKK